jgi:hypothetical protein
MTVQHDRVPRFVKCDVVVHGNGLFANVRAFDISSPEGRFIDLGILKPNNFIRLEMTLFQDDWLIVQLGRVQWVDQGTVAVAILQMDEHEKRKLDEAAWSCVRGEPRLFRWLRKQFWGDEIRYIYITFPTIPNVQAVRLQEAA